MTAPATRDRLDTLCSPDDWEVRYRRLERRVRAPWWRRCLASVRTFLAL